MTKSNSIEKSNSSLRKILNLIPSQQISASLLLDSFLDISVDTICNILNNNDQHDLDTFSSSEVNEYSDKAKSHVYTALLNFIKEFGNVDNNVDDDNNQSSICTVQSHQSTISSKTHSKKGKKNFTKEFTSVLVNALENVIVPVGFSIPPTYEDDHDIVDIVRDIDFDTSTSTNSDDENGYPSSIRMYYSQKKRRLTFRDRQKSQKVSQQYHHFERIKHLALQQTYAKLIDAIHLRSVTQTIRCINNRKRCFEVYILPAPTTQFMIHNSIPSFIKKNSENDKISSIDRNSLIMTNIIRQKLNTLKLRIQKEFNVFHQGAGDDSHCRVYACLRHLKGHRLSETLPDGVQNLNYQDSNELHLNLNDKNKSKQQNQPQSVLYLQINVGKQQQRHGRFSVSELSKEYIVVLRPGTTLLALATSGKVPSSLQYTPFILTAIGSALCSTDAALLRNDNQSSFHQQYNSLSGPDPLALLHSALSTLKKSAVSRFACIINQGNKLHYENSPGQKDPLLDLNNASVGANPFKNGTEKCHEMKNKNLNSAIIAQAQSIQNGTNATSALKATNKAGVIVDHSHSIVESRKRGRQEELGNFCDCPKLEKLSWKWTGDTYAAIHCFRKDDDVFEDGFDFDHVTRDGRNHSKNGSNNGKIKFKCGIVLEGSNVFEGIRALMAEGIAKTPLPDYVRDAPMLGTNVITVKDEKIARMDRK